MPATALEPIVVDHAGKRLIGELARPARRHHAALAPAVLVMANAHGLGPQPRAVARELADLGYLALCTDMYGGGAWYAEPGAAGEDFQAVMSQPELLRERVCEWFTAAVRLEGADPKRIAAIGYCFGGRCVIELARSGADVKAVVSFHGLLTTHRPAAPGTIHGDVVAWCGGRDPYAPAEDIAALARELTDAGVRHQISVFSDAAHAFTDPGAGRHGREGIAYHALADKVSWAGTLALLACVLAP